MKRLPEINTTSYSNKYAKNLYQYVIIANSLIVVQQKMVENKFSIEILADIKVFLFPSIVNEILLNPFPIGGQKNLVTSTELEDMK